MPEDNQQNDNNQTEDITLEKMQADLDSAINGWKRAQADFENYRKRKEAENKELIEFAKEVTVVKLLPIIDSLEQALRHMPSEENQESPVAEPTSRHATGQARIKNQVFFEKYQNWQTGINGILAQLDKTLGELGVKKIEALEKKFDPHLHEAIKEIESEREDGVVVDELQPGFMLNGKVIRPSQVTISKRVKN
jgi:molecular chaperone GrpE